jgi:hypothetical protein
LRKLFRIAGVARKQGNFFDNVTTMWTAAGLTLLRAAHDAFLGSDRRADTTELCRR